MTQTILQSAAASRFPLLPVAILSTCGLITLSGCGDDYPTHTGNFTPTSYEYGLVAVDLDADGLTDVISANTLFTPTAPYESGTLRTWLRDTASTFAAPTSYSAGREPLFLASGAAPFVSADYRRNLGFPGYVKEMKRIGVIGG